MFIVANSDVNEIFLSIADVSNLIFMCTCRCLSRPCLFYSFILHNCLTVPCPFIEAPVNGKMTVKLHASFRCDKGYAMVGPSELTCSREDCTWSGKRPVCTKGKHFTRFGNIHLANKLTDKFLNSKLRDHGGTLVTHSPPTCEVGCSNNETYVGKLLVAY